MQPLVSVIIPTHNRPQMLVEALASIRAQTYSDFEIIIVSNGENAETRSVTRSFADAHGARYFELDKGNVSIARNFGIEQAQGDWIAFLDDDDLWLPNKLERQIAEAQRTGADLITCDCVRFFLDGRKFIVRIRPANGWSYVKAISHLVWWCVPSCVMVRKRVLEEIGGFDVRLRWNEDNDVWRRISWSHRIHQVDEILARYRCGHEQAMHPRHNRARLIYDLRHYAKMCRDTPRPFRHELPAAKAFVIPRLIEVFAPSWLLDILHLIKPRTRLKQLRHRLRLRTRARACRQVVFGLVTAGGSRQQADRGSSGDDAQGRTLPRATQSQLAQPSRAPCREGPRPHEQRNRTRLRGHTVGGAADLHHEPLSYWHSV
jgi:glycosyltransferase involved in cell wall biosynthesis